MDFTLPEHAAQLQRTVRDFCEAEVKPKARDWDRSGVFPMATVKKMGELGLLGLATSEEYGGAGLDAVAVETVVEEVARYDGSLALTVASHNGLCSSHLRLFGNETQKR